MVSILLILSIIASVLTPNSHQPANAASFVFLQNSWAGGVSANIASHPDNKTAWTNYASASTSVSFAAPTALKLTSSTYSTTDDATLTTTGDDTGGGFGNGTVSNITVGSGSFSIATSSQTAVNAWSSALATPPYSYPKQILRNGLDNDIYVLESYAATYFYAGATPFYKYSISGNSWTTLASIPTHTDGVMIRNGSDNDIYLLAAGNHDVTPSQGFYKYSISANTWTSLAQFPVIPDYDAKIIRKGGSDDVYAIQGFNNTGFYKYSISGNSWTVLTAVPSAVQNGSQMLSYGSEDSIYVLPGNNSTNFYKYSISANTWTTLASVPGTIGAASQMLRNSSDNDIYLLRGNCQNSFYKYSISANSWTTLTNKPAASCSPVGMVRKGAGDYIYVSGGYDYGPWTIGTGFYRYSISANSWDTLQSQPVGLKVFFSSDDDEQIYGLGRQSGTAFYRFVINQTSYFSSGTFTSAPIDIGAGTLSSLSWTSSAPAAAGSNAVRLQIATSTDNSTWSSFFGSDGTSGTYFTSSPSTLSGVASGGTRYLKYKVYLATDDTSVTPTFNDFTVNYSSYSLSGNLTSSIYDSGDPTNVIADLAWSSTVPSNTSLKFQIRTASTSAGIADVAFTGPNGSASAYFNTSGGESIASNFTDGFGDRFFQYKAFFASVAGVDTPILSSVSVTYVVNNPPEAQNVTAAHASNGVVNIGFDARDSDTNTGSANPGFVSSTFAYLDAEGVYQSIPANQLGSGDTSNRAVTNTAWTTHTASWTPPSGLYLTASRIRVTLNDNEAANNTASAISGTFILDSVAPTNNVIAIDGSQSPYGLILSSTDSSTLQMKISANSDLSGASWQTFASTSTISGAATAYAQFKDAYGNTSSIVSGSIPETPVNVMVQDNSNIQGGLTDYRLFIAWKVVALPTPGFGSYKVYRSENQNTWTLVGTVTGRTTNYFTDQTTALDTLYYYRVTASDANGSASGYSSTVSAKANGVQDAGEGGGGSTTTELTISNVATSTPNPSSMTIGWDTNVLSNSTVGYSTTAGNFTANTVTVNTMADSSSGSGAHSVVLSNLTPNTTYYFRVRSVTSGGVTATDDNGGNGYVFTTPNGVTISGVSSPEVYNTSAKVVWTTSGAANSSVIYATSTAFSNAMTTSSAAMETDHSLNLVNLSEGATYFYYVQSVNTSGVTTTDRNVLSGVPEYYTLATSLDTTAPLISSVASSTTHNSAAITWTTNELADSQVEYGLADTYGATSTLDPTYTISHIVSLTGLSSSTLYHYRVRSADKNNNVRFSGDKTFTTAAGSDTVPAVISSVATSSVFLTGITVTWTTNENASSLVEYGTSTSSYSGLSGTAAVYSTAHSVALTGLSGNTGYYFRVRSLDSAGNVALDDNNGAGYSFITSADTAAPVITNTQTSVVNNTSANIVFSTNEAATSEVYYGTSTSSLTSSITTSTLETTHSITLSNLEKLTAYYYYVKAADASGNTSTDNNSGSFYTFTTLRDPITVVNNIVSGGGGSVSLDLTAPRISNVKVSDITTSSAVIAWSTNEQSSSLVTYGRTISYDRLAGSYSDRVYEHKVTLNGLFSGMAYHFKAASADSSGNIGESADQSFTTVKGDGWGEEEAAKISDVAPLYDPGTSLMNDMLKAAPARLVRIFLKAISENPFLSDVPNLKDISDESFTKAMAEMTQKIVDPPVIVGLKPQAEVHGTTAVIRWSTDKKSSSAVAYTKESGFRVAADGGNPYTEAVINPNEFDNKHIVTISNLEPGVTYHYQVSSKGTIGPESKSGDHVFTTETELPVISDIRIQKVSEASAIISWKTNVPTTANIEYTNLKTGKVLTQGDQTLLRSRDYTLKNLEGGAQYSMILLARDEFGNETSSLPIKFSTSVDNVPPVISKLASESTLYPGKDSKVQTIISWETDELTTSQVFYFQGVYEPGQETALPADEFLTNKHMVVVTKFKPGQAYKYWVESADASGNRAKSDVFSILTPQEQETILDIIVHNFENVFGWTNRLKKR